jgi:COP9 signalosome complex subunit 8
MELPTLSIEHLKQLDSSNLPPSQLFEILARYESDACIMTAGSSHPETDSDDSQLLSLFYSSFFFAHLLTKQM